MTNEEFFVKYADEAMVGLVGGTHFIDQGIRKTQKKITKDKAVSAMSHVFIVGEKRRDGKRWVIESDLQFNKTQVLVGVQENRIDKYFDEKMFPNIALLDFGLSKKHKEEILSASLDLVSARASYSMKEIFGILLSFKPGQSRKTENRFGNRNDFVCSTFVQHLYLKAGIRFNPEVSERHITPEDIFNTGHPCKRQSLIRLK